MIRKYESTTCTTLYRYCRVSRDAQLTKRDAFYFSWADRMHGTYEKDLERLVIAQVTHLLLGIHARIDNTARRYAANLRQSIQQQPTHLPKCFQGKAWSIFATMSATVSTSSHVAFVFFELYHPILIGCGAVGPYVGRARGQKRICEMCLNQLVKPIDLLEYVFFVCLSNWRDVQWWMRPTL